MTKEIVKQAYEGKLKNTDEDWQYYDGSINDDLESFFLNLQTREVFEDEFVTSFFTPKLTEDEMKLVQVRNEDHLNTYMDYLGPYKSTSYPDVDAEEMKKSNSKSKYVHARCARLTIALVS